MNQEEFKEKIKDKENKELFKLGKSVGKLEMGMKMLEKAVKE